MDIFVISLKDAFARRLHIDQQFGEQKIKFHYFNAVEPDQIETVISNTGFELKGCSLTKGEIGCFLSHISLWKKIVDENLPYMAIFEDDIHLSSSAKIFLSDTNWIPKDIDIVKLEAFSKVVSIKLYSKKTLIAKRYLHLLKGRHLGTAGYIISNQGARDILNYIKNLPEISPIDNILFEKYIDNNKVYQIFPALCIQDFIYNNENTKFISSLQFDREIRHAGEKDPSIKINKMSLKLKREFFRIFCQIYNLYHKFFEKKVKFK